jgi:transcriptional regulator with PAS, ATPase and Fis domain
MEGRQADGKGIQSAIEREGFQYYRCREITGGEMANSEWIITPGLKWAVDNFISLYAYLKIRPGRKLPIMILGDRGVGKSLFVHIYETLYKKDNPNLYPKVDIVRLNAASLMDTLVDSELFGHIKGAFTGAITNKVGLVEKAKLLILEEIGDIPEYVQAKLLTFLEDGKFRRVGGNKEEDAKQDLQIIATTNKNRDEMRPDFYDRFIKFTVPPLYKRREDIFYYMLQFAPSILPELTTWEIMSLLAYPWPGNVREIAAVSMDMENAHLDFLVRYKELYLLKPKLKIFLRPLGFAKIEHTEIKKVSTRKRYQSMKRANVDVSLLQKLMNRYDLGFDDPGRWTFPWAKKDFSSPLSSLEDDKKRDAYLGTKTYREDIFSGISEGLRFYCDLFWRDAEGDVNLLSVKSEKGRKQAISPPFCYIEEPTDKHDALVKSILEYCLRRQIDQSMRSVSLINMDSKKYEKWAKKTFNIPAPEPEEDRANDVVKEPKENPFDMKLNDLLRDYYKYNLEKTNENKSQAAKKAGLPRSTFCDELKRLDLTL